MRLFILFLACWPLALAARDLPLAQIQLPPGFAIGTYADDVPDARSLALGENGTVFVGSRTAGKVYALVDRDRDGRADEVLTVAHGLNMPNGVAYRGGALYVAEVNRILRYDEIEAHLDDPPVPAVVYDGFPGDRHHGWKFIAFGPDGWLYVPVGAPCNSCRPDERHALISRITPDGKRYEVVARGVRNSVGFDWHPGSGELWFTDNGRDWLGDELPHDELNRVSKAGEHFGYPYCHQGDFPDPEFGAQHGCGEFVPPAAKLGAHVAALGMRFYGGKMFPAVYRGQIFIAQHGSWNRSSKVGYRVMRAKLDGEHVVEYAPFAAGWLQGESAWGRPVDVLVMPDGALLVSDDYAGAVYRIAYRQP